MKVGGEWLERDDTQAVFDALAGHRALAVGGCVRNALLGVPVEDVDIATDARPETVMALAEAAGLKAVPTGLDHGTVTVVAGGHPHEITTFRRDVATDGRRAVVAFSDDVAEDARRRDFTMNALYATRVGTLVDPLGGIGDLHARRVRFVGDAEARIREDYLRILRFFRFHAWYGDAEGGLDPEGLAACATLSDGIAGLSNERLGAEMRKLLAAPDPAPSVAAMAASGALARVLPGADPVTLPRLVAAERALTAPPDPIRRLAVLGGEDPAGRLRLSRADTRRLAQLRQLVGAEAGTAEVAWRHGRQVAIDVELLRAAAYAAPLAATLMADVEAGVAARFPVAARDLMPDYEGPALGRKLAELEARWIASGFALDREALLS